MNKLATFWIILFTVFLFFTSTVVAESNMSLLDEIQKRGVLKVGVYLQYPPTGFRDTVTKKPKGLEVDIANLLAKDIGVKVELIDMEWDALVPGLLSKKYDVIIASMSRKPSRNLSIAFTSNNLEDYAMVAMVRPNEKRNSVDEFNQKGVVVSCVMGATSEQAARRFFPNATIKTLQQTAATLEVLSGRADLQVTENVYAYNYVKENPGKLKVVFEENPLTHEPSAIGLRKGDQVFLNWLDNWIQYQWDNRVLNDLIDKWLKKGSVE